MREPARNSPLHLCCPRLKRREVFLRWVRTRGLLAHRPSPDALQGCQGHRTPPNSSGGTHLCVWHVDVSETFGAGAHASPLFPHASYRAPDQHRKRSGGASRSKQWLAYRPSQGYVGRLPEIRAAAARRAMPARGIGSVHPFVHGPCRCPGAEVDLLPARTFWAYAPGPEADDCWSRTCGGSPDISQARVWSSVHRVHPAA